MEEKAKKIILCALKTIKYRSDLSPDITKEQETLKEQVLKRFSSDYKGLAESTTRQRNKYFDLFLGKRVDLFYKNLSGCGIDFVELSGILDKLRQDGILKDFAFKYDLPKGSRYELILPNKFNSKIQTYVEKLNEDTLRADAPKITDQGKLSATEKIGEGNGKKELTKITVVTPQYGKFDYLWVVLNDDHKNKIKLPTKSKQSPNGESYGKQLFNLAKSNDREIELDKSLTDYLSGSIWDGVFKNYKKRKILKRENNKIRPAERIDIETITVQSLSESDRDYYPKIL